MIHRTSLFVFFDSPSPPSSPSLPPSPFRHAARLIVVCPYLPTYLPTYLPFRRVASQFRIDSRAHDIPTGHSRSLCLPSRLFSSRFSFTSIDFPRSFVRSTRSGIRRRWNCPPPDDWAPKDFIAVLLVPRNVHEICVHVHVTERKTTPFILSY